MPLIQILSFVIVFYLIVYVCVYTFLIFYNKKNSALTKRFLSQVKLYDPKVIPNVKLRYWITRRLRTWTSPGTYGDLYLFDNCLVIVRRRNFIFKIFHPPVLFTPDMDHAKKNFPYLKAYQPGYIHFNQLHKSEIEIKVKDPDSGTWMIDITLKGLSADEVNQVSEIKNWTDKVVSGNQFQKMI